MNALTPVISKEQAKQITGGRTPLMPVEYETAVNALTACLAIDEAKIWADKADALAAWAKIYHSSDAEQKARQLKLHAYRRMGELARELRPGPRDAAPVNSGVPGPRSLLIENGLTKHQGESAIKLSRLPTTKFEEIVRRPIPPSPGGWHNENRSARIRINSCLAQLAGLVQELPPREFLRDAPARASNWRENAEEAYIWLTVVLQKRNG